MNTLHLFLGAIAPIVGIIVCLIMFLQLESKEILGGSSTATRRNGRWVRIPYFDSDKNKGDKN